jgi:hypothetical protein
MYNLFTWVLTFATPIRQRYSDKAMIIPFAKNTRGARDTVNRLTVSEKRASQNQRTSRNVNKVRARPEQVHAMRQCGPME